MKKQIVRWIEGYFYYPNSFHKLLSVVLLPLAFLYCLIGAIRFRMSNPVDYSIPIISVGNLTVGGSVIALANYFSRPAIILRGYGRQSKGMIVVKDRQILCDVEQSGDEAMVYATQLQNAVVIVSENRERAIAEAIAMGCELVFLDDGYGKHRIKKLDLIIDVKTPNPFCLPSGPYREKHWRNKEAIHLEEGYAFVRHVIISNPTEKMVLVTAIARPERLDPFLPSDIEKIYFEDHHYFAQYELQNILDNTQATSLLVTQKDFVKMASFKLPLSILELDLEVKPELVDIVRRYISAKKD